MTQFLIEPARRTGCEDIPALTEVLQTAAQRQRSPIDDVLDAGLVDEEKYMRELAHDLGIEWLDVIPMAEVHLPMREACGPRIALRHRLLPVGGLRCQGFQERAASVAGRALRRGDFLFLHCGYRQSAQRGHPGDPAEPAESGGVSGAEVMQNE